MVNRSPPSGRRLVQPDNQLARINVGGRGELTPKMIADAADSNAKGYYEYLIQLVRDIEINFFDTAEVEIQTQTIVTSVNNNITVIQSDVAEVSSIVTSITSVFANDISVLDAALASSVSVLDARITSVADNVSVTIPFSGIILRNGAGYLITQDTSTIFRTLDGRDTL